MPGALHLSRHSPAEVHQAATPVGPQTWFVKRQVLVQ